MAGLVQRAVRLWRTGRLKLFKDYAILAGGQIVSKLLGFVAFAWLARVLEPEGYGAVEYVVGLSVFFAMVVDGGLGAIGVRRAVREPGALETLAFQIPIARLLIAVIGVPAMAILASTAMKSPAPPGLIWLFALSLLSAPWRQEWLFQASDRMTEASIAQVLRMVVFAGAVWWFVRQPHQLMAVGWAEIAGIAATTLYCLYVQQTRITPIRLRGSFHNFLHLIREGSAIGMTNLVWALNQYVPLFFIGSMVGGAPVAFFGAASRLVGSLLTFSNIYHFNLFPVVSRASVGDKAKLAALMSRSFRVVTWGGAFAGLTFTVLAQPVVNLAFGAKLAEAAPMLKVMIWSLPIALCSGHARWGLTAAGAQTRVLWSQLSGLAAILILSPVLGHLMGGMGFAIASVAGPLVVWLVSHVFAVRYDTRPPPLAIALLPAGLAGLLIAACEIFDPGLWPRIAAIAAFAAAGPILDRRLIPDLSLLGRAKLDGGDAARSNEA